MNTYTDLENEVIDGFLGNRYSFFDEGFVNGSDTWTDIFIEECGDPKIFRGVISSLIQKGFFKSARVDGDSALWLTQLAEDEIESRKTETVATPKLDLLAAALDRDVLFSKKEIERVNERMSSEQFTSSFTIDSIIESEAKLFATQFVLDIICDSSILATVKEEGEDGVFKIIRDRLLYRITSMTSAPRSTSPSHNMIENARHYALIDILSKI